MHLPLPAGETSDRSRSRVYPRSAFLMRRSAIADHAISDLPEIGILQCAGRWSPARSITRGFYLSSCSFEPDAATRFELASTAPVLVRMSKFPRSVPARSAKIVHE